MDNRVQKALEERVSDMISKIPSLKQQNSFLQLLICLIKLRKIRKEPYQLAVTYVLGEFLKTFPLHVLKWQKEAIEESQKIAFDFFFHFKEEDIREGKKIIEEFLPSDYGKYRIFLKNELKIKMRDMWNDLDAEMSDRERIAESANEACGVSNVDAFKFKSPEDMTINSFFIIMADFFQKNGYEKIEAKIHTVSARRENYCVLISATLASGMMYITISDIIVSSRL